MIHFLDFIAYYYHHRIKFQSNILVWRKALLFQEMPDALHAISSLWQLTNYLFSATSGVGKLPQISYSSLKVCKTGVQLISSSLWQWKFSVEKNPSPSPRYILIRPVIHRILTSVDTGLFQILQIAGWFGRMKSQMKSQKCVCNTFVMFFSWASFFYEIDHNILIDFPCAAHTWHKTKWSCCKLEAVYKQITEISHSLKANGHTLLANPERPSSTLPPMCS